MLKIRRPLGRLIFNMGIAIPGKTVFLIETAPSALVFNSSPLDQNGHHFADDIFKRIFLEENGRILIRISLKFVSKGQIDNESALVWVIAWRRTSDTPLPEPMLTCSLTHICDTKGHAFIHWITCCRKSLYQIAGSLMKHLLWVLWLNCNRYVCSSIARSRSWETICLWIDNLFDTIA